MLQFNFASTALRRRYDHSTTYVTTVTSVVEWCGGAAICCDLNEQIGQRDCRFYVTVVVMTFAKPSNARRIEV